MMAKLSLLVLVSTTASAVHTALRGQHPEKGQPIVPEAQPSVWPTGAMFDNRHFSEQVKPGAGGEQWDSPFDGVNKAFDKAIGGANNYAANVVQRFADPSNYVPVQTYPGTDIPKINTPAKQAMPWDAATRRASQDIQPGIGGAPMISFPGFGNAPSTGIPAFR
eukprot:gnl/MRDRNA2_/MRDRNA2_62131_c0_seq1.p1 gnl/MRDRNA2_/MRDRNA2_62131_c0~~gnl/MRDRNA2_/MRDRNA2_62131_c0_seq1.p1  ORF type:complete len:164 (+),score=30.45 gnl/MRDRNA2_/MRDRNA2_62131_c0_seq1:74-565(+)